jgi:hypothetical protein
VSAQQGDVTATCRAYFYRFSLNADGQPSALAALPGSGQAGLPTALAASADGSKLAFSVTHCGGSGATKIPRKQPIGYIGLLDTASGKITARWTYTLGEDYTTSMSLTPDGHQLAFAQYRTCMRAQAPTDRPRRLPTNSVCTAWRPATRSRSCTLGRGSVLRAHWLPIPSTDMCSWPYRPRSPSTAIPRTPSACSRSMCTPAESRGY